MLATESATGATLKLGEVATVVVFTSTMALYMGRKFQNIEDKLDEHSERLKNLPCRTDKEKQDCEKAKE